MVSPSMSLDATASPAAVTLFHRSPSESGILMHTVALNMTKYDHTGQPPVISFRSGWRKFTSSPMTSNFEQSSTHESDAPLEGIRDPNQWKGAFYVLNLDAKQLLTRFIMYSLAALGLSILFGEKG